jgi:hypothetical protein
MDEQKFLKKGMFRIRSLSKGSIKRLGKELKAYFE